MSRGHFVARLADHFGFLTKDRLQGLIVVVRDLTEINMDELVRLRICERLMEVPTWVAPGPERWQNVAARAVQVHQEIHEEGVQTDLTLVQAPPSAAPAARTMPQRMVRLKEEVHRLRESLGEQRVVLDAMTRYFSRYRCARTKLITPYLTYPSTYQLLRSSGGDSRHDLSFDKSASPERLFSLACVSLAEASKPDLSFRWSRGDYTSSCSPSLIELTVTLFRVFQMLCKQGDWFSVAKRRAPSPGHPNAAIDDLWPTVGSFSMANVRRLSTHVIKLRDIPEGVLVLSGLNQVWKSRVFMGIYDFLCLPEWTRARVQEEPHLDVRLTLQRLPFYCTHPATTYVVLPDPTLEDLAVRTPSSKILAKAKASQKRKASTSGDSEGDDYAYVEIPLVTPLRSTAVIPSLGNQGRSSTVPATEGSNTRDTHGKCIMADDAATPSVGVSRLRPSSRLAYSFRDVSGNAIHVDFFPFPASPYYATYPQDGIVGNYEFTREDGSVSYSREIVRVEALFEYQLTAKMSVLHCMMMSHGGELLSRYCGLLQSYHEYVWSADSRLKGYEERVAGVAGLELQMSILKKKKKIKSLTKSLDNLHVEVVRLSTALNQAIVLEVEKDEEDLVQKFLTSDEFSRVLGELLSLVSSAGFEHGLSMHHTKDEFTAVLKKMDNFKPGLEPENLARPANVPTSRDAHVSPPITKESTVTPASKSLEVALEVVVELVVVGSGCAPSGLNDVVVTLSAGEKGNGLFPFSAADEDAATNPSGL
ncbi:hypothetical protein Tco_0627766 [Tanacetum coccineum]|uniref:Uncharacterized protein n=1 Tax=Tanacetum coccineum TaxID=301880 RepID=A0ABQ4WND8_9ASTR